MDIKIFLNWKEFTRTKQHLKILGKPNSFQWILFVLWYISIRKHKFIPGYLLQRASLCWVATIARPTWWWPSGTQDRVLCAWATSMVPTLRTVSVHLSHEFRRYHSVTQKAGSNYTLLGVSWTREVTQSGSSLGFCVSLAKQYTSNLDWEIYDSINLSCFFSRINTPFRWKVEWDRYF